MQSNVMQSKSKIAMKSKAKHSNAMQSKAMLSKAVQHTAGKIIE